MYDRIKIKYSEWGKDDTGKEYTLNNVKADYLDKSYGINKQYELTSLNDIYSYTVYYVSNFN